MAYGLHFGGAIGKYALSLVRIALVIGIIVMFKKWLKEGASNYLIIPMSMIFAGAIGNLIDGMFYGLIFDTGTIFEPSIGHWVGYDGISNLERWICLLYEWLCCGYALFSIIQVQLANLGSRNWWYRI
jgi:signal peptidase II